MTMPGFNAEASLYRTRTLYSANGLLGQPRGAVRPQFGRNSACVDDCEASCPTSDDCFDAKQGSQRAACLVYARACPESLPSTLWRPLM